MVADGVGSECLITDGGVVAACCNVIKGVVSIGSIGVACGSYIWVYCEGTRGRVEQGIVFTDNRIYPSHNIAEVRIHLSSTCCLPVYKGICYGDGLRECVATECQKESGENDSCHEGLLEIRERV